MQEKKKICMWEGACHFACEHAHFLASRLQWKFSSIPFHTPSTHSLSHMHTHRQKHTHLVCKVRVSVRVYLCAELWDSIRRPVLHHHRQLWHRRSGASSCMMGNCVCFRPEKEKINKPKGWGCEHWLPPRSQDAPLPISRQLISGFTRPKGTESST